MLSRVMKDAAAGVNAQAWRGPSALADQAGKAAQQWDSAGGTRRLWDKDASLWTGADEAKWLGWLGAIDAGRALLPALQDIAAGVRRDGFTHALLLGMGGSSLCPEVAGPHLRTPAGRPGAARPRLDGPVAGRGRSRAASTSIARW